MELDIHEQLCRFSLFLLSPRAQMSRVGSERPNHHVNYLEFSIVNVITSQRQFLRYSVGFASRVGRRSTCVRSARSRE